VRSRSEDSTKLRLLEVGAIKPDNYRTCYSWIDWTPIDLHSRHHQILEQDFLLMDADQHANKWDAISLSLVLNFVPLPFDRGRMLKLANNMLVSDGLLFLSLPLPCVANSRYITFEHLKSLMLSIGFSEVRNRWRQKGKMAYWLYKKTTISEIQPSSTFDKRVVLRQGRRNNFAITLTGMASMKVKWKLHGSGVLGSGYMRTYCKRHHGCMYPTPFSPFSLPFSFSDTGSFIGFLRSQLWAEKLKQKRVYSKRVMEYGIIIS